ncbi:MAG TPA: hypothetical protein VFQ53_12665 [Kofleriaceae bacterium]|nr:hypothetical protein [Kofleriaceae bacterium]
MTKLLLAALVLSSTAVAFADTPAPKEDGKGTLKPGQYAGVRKCLGSTAGVNIDVTSKRTIGVATCKIELQKVFIQDKHMCDGKAKREKVEYSWQFGEGDKATTGKHYFTCP